MRNDLCQASNLLVSNLLRMRYFTLIIIFVVVVFASCSANPSSNSSPVPATVTENTKNPLPDLAAAVQAGKPLFSIHCAMCHGDDGKGDGIAGSSLAVKPTDLTVGDVVSDADGKHFLVVKNGIRKDGKLTMPPAKKITDDQIWQIVAYMRTLAKT